MSGRHTAATSAQLQHMQAARADRTSYAKVNGGHPHTLARSAVQMEKAALPARDPLRSDLPRAKRQGRERQRTDCSSGANCAEIRIAKSSDTHYPGEPDHARDAESHTAKRHGQNPRTDQRKDRARTETHTASSRTETRPSPSKTEPRTETHTASSRTESHPSTAREETRTEPRTAPAEKPKTESHAATAPHADSRRSPETHAEARPVPAPRAESHAAPSKPAEPRAESHPAPQHESHPAPAAHPAPQHASHSEPQPKQEKPKPETR